MPNNELANSTQSGGSVLEKESGKQHGDPLDHDSEPTLKPSSDPLPAPGDDNRHPHSPVAP